jgi:hypothetical protein
LQLSVRPLLALHVEVLTGKRMKRVGDHDIVRNDPTRNSGSMR